MNCKHVQDLLPLYAGGDVEEKTAEILAGHLRACVECSRLAGEYRETTQMMQQLAPPQFSESVYSGIRKRVLLEIEPKAAPSLSGRIDGFFRPKHRLAFAAGLLLVTGMFAFYFISFGDSETPQIADGRAADRTADKQRTDQISAPPDLDKETEAPEAFPDAARSIIPPQGKVTKQRTGRADKRKTQAVARFVTEKPAAPDKPDFPVTDRPAPSQTLAVSPKSRVPEKTLRMELQTNDPNIRIIWFADLQANKNSGN